MVPGKRLLQHRLQQRRHFRLQRLGADQRIDTALLGQLPQQIGQAGANRHLATKQLHAVARAGFKGELIALEALAHLDHIILQRRAADEPLIRQIFQLDGERRRQEAHQQKRDTILGGSRHVLRLRRRLLQRLKARRVINFQLITAAAVEDKLRAILRQQRIQGGNIGAHGTGGNRQALRQLILRQRFISQQGEELR